MSTVFWLAFVVLFWRLRVVRGAFLGWALVMICVVLMWIVAFFVFGL